MQVVALTRLWELPPEFEVRLRRCQPIGSTLTLEQIVCRDIWTLHLSLLPDPLPAEPLHSAEPATEVPSTHKDGEKSPPAGGSGDEAEDENTVRGSNSETSSSSSDDEDDEDPQMAELMRQAEESPSSSEDDDEQGGDAHKKVPAHRKKKSRFGRKYDMPVNNLVVHVLACWTLRLPVTYMDFIRHVDLRIVLACHFMIFPC